MLCRLPSSARHVGRSGDVQPYGHSMRVTSCVPWLLVTEGAAARLQAGEGRVGGGSWGKRHGHLAKWPGHALKGKAQGTAVRLRLRGQGSVSVVWGVPWPAAVRPGTPGVDADQAVDSGGSQER